jgi:hypothetical protein
MKLIDKDYAVDTAWSIDVYHGSTREVCEMLEDAPEVEAEPIIETTLIIRKMDCIEELKCDKCRMAWLWSGDLFIFNYCPYCGAKVIGKRYKKERKNDETN